MKEEELKALAKLSMYNKERLQKSNSCGCYYCGNIFDPKIIDDWTDKGLVTAICPHCGIDSVLDEASGGTNLDVLEAMHQQNFLQGFDSKGNQIQIRDRRKKPFNG